MVSNRATTLQFDELTVECSSRAGDETWFRVQPPGLAIDVGRGTPRLRGASPLLLTHGHLDHILGVAFLLSLRGQTDDPPLQVYCPAPASSALDEMLVAAGRLEGEPLRYELRPVEPGDRFRVGQGLWAETFAVDHVVVGVGYHLIRERKRLRADLRGLEGDEIVRRRQAGESVEETNLERWLSVTGDSSARVFDLVPELLSSRILVTECTFLEPQHRERATRFGHIHFEDLVRLRAEFANSYLVLSHLSSRHAAAELRTAVSERLEPLVPEVLIVGEGDWREQDGDG